MPSAELSALAGVIAFFALLPAWINYDIISMDGAMQYVPMAKLLLAGKYREVFINNAQLPLFPLVIAGISKMTGLELELSGRIASYIGYILAAVGMLKLGELLFKNRAIAILAALFLITNRQIVNRSVDCLKESLFLCCIVWGNYFVLKWISADRERSRHLVLGICILLIGALFRSTSLVFIFVWFFIWIFHEQKGLYARISLLIIPAAIILVLLVTDKEMLNVRKGGYNLTWFLDDVHSFKDLLRNAKDVFLHFFSIGNPLLMVAGIYGVYHTRKNVYFYHVCLLLVSFFLILILWPCAANRYFLAPIVWIYPLAAFGTAHALRTKSVTLKTMGILVIISSIVLWAHISMLRPDPDRMAWKDAGIWILSHYGPDREVISNRERLVFYAQGKLLPLSAFEDAKPHGKIIALDPGYENGGALYQKLRSRGYVPERQFRSISIYLPKT